MASRPLLVEFLPKGGFQWSSNSGAHFIRNDQARRVVRAMKLAGRRLDESVCTEYIARLFDAAKDLVRHCRSYDAAGFWGFVSCHVPWAVRISPEDLYDLSIRIISARRIFLDQRDFWVEMKQEDDFKNIPDNYFIRVFNEANTAFYPAWTNDSDNEGTAEATKERFREKCEAPRNLPVKTTAEDQSKGLEGKYEEMVEMVGNVEIVDRMDEGMDAEMGEMDCEMDYEMEDAMDN
ncbi:hypothetical protein F4813DRAFT_391767 [Daldinia decipiens]|uniref:uncharacterized protein n=1 Tax=Daldinia decipiens TaxID=326647 RepID=UPI0020C483D5|nr:uncharacterized protein F4813DRAFT_391767 [Daldinia decipiens]KAI1655345.1 hypothetical protein F4813DRAFT_391767 [Daldinia decipiens]